MCLLEEGMGELSREVLDLPAASREPHTEALSQRIVLGV